jgi:hypothetical protein
MDLLSSAQFLLSSAQWCGGPWEYTFGELLFLAAVFARRSWWVHVACIFATSQQGKKKPHFLIQIKKKHFKNKIVFLSWQT